LPLAEIVTVVGFDFIFFGIGAVAVGEHTDLTRGSERRSQ
jgi:hypothetical protein